MLRRDKSGQETNWIELLNVTQAAPQQGERPLPPDRRVMTSDIADCECQQSVKIIILDRQTAVHVPLTQRHFGVSDHLSRQLRVMEDQADARASAIAITVLAAIGHRYM